MTPLQQELLEAIEARVEVKRIRIELHKYLFVRTDIHRYVTREANALMRKGLVECMGNQLYLSMKGRKTMNELADLSDHTNLWPFETKAEVGPCVDFVIAGQGKVLIDGEVTAEQLDAIAAELRRK